MTNHIIVKNIPPRIQYVADGESKTFEFPFIIFRNADLKVYIGEELQNDNTYSITTYQNSTGGSITFGTAPQEDALITLLRELSIERTSDFQEGSALRADALNYEFDYQVACQQQIADNLNRSMVLPPYAATTGVNLTLPEPSAGKAIVWNSDGTNLENSTVKVNDMEEILREYKTSAQEASTTAVAKAQEAATKADEASQSAAVAATKAQEAYSTLEIKANKNMDNLSDTGKENISSWIVPDYTAGVSLPISNTTENSYTATYNCFICLVMWGFNTSKAYYTINNVKFDLGATTSNQAQVPFVVNLYLKKGDVIAYKSGYTDLNTVKNIAMVYPLGGE